LLIERNHDGFWRDFVLAEVLQKPTCTCDELPLELARTEGARERVGADLARLKGIVR